MGMFPIVNQNPAWLVSDPRDVSQVVIDFSKKRGELSVTFHLRSGKSLVTSHRGPDSFEGWFRPGHAYSDYVGNVHTTRLPFRKPL